MKTRKIFAALLALVMTTGTVLSVSAADAPPENAWTGQQNAQNETSGSGTLEGYTNRKVFRVVLPTASLDYKLDPQGLIKASGNKKYLSDKTVKFNFDTNGDGKVTTDDANDGFVLFGTTDPKTNSTVYANNITVTVENKGTVDVDVTPTLNGSDSNVSFTMKDGNEDAGKKVLKGIPTYYETTYVAAENNTGSYKYSLNDVNYGKLTAAQKATLGNVYSLKIIGTSNPTADYSSYTAPAVKVTWTIAEHVEEAASDPEEQQPEEDVTP